MKQKAAIKQITKQETLKITKDMMIASLTEKYPSVVEVLLNEGVHCIGCGSSQFETIEQGLASHGKTEAEIQDVVKRMNKAIPKLQGSQETLLITEKAAAKIRDLLASKPEGTGLRVGVEPGGCSGFMYTFAFAKEAGKVDQTITIGQVKFFLDKESMQLLKGSTLDYIESLQASGFKISNPNATKTCGCGSSFS